MLGGNSGGGQGTGGEGGGEAGGNDGGITGGFNGGGGDGAGMNTTTSMAGWTRRTGTARVADRLDAKTSPLTVAISFVASSVAEGMSSNEAMPMEALRFSAPI